MITQAKADELLALIKILTEKGTVIFPQPGEIKHLEAKSEDGKEAFILDVNRKGKIKVTKCTYQERYQVVEILLRLDIDGPSHDNPDGTEVPCPHLHIYKEGYADKWAYPVPSAEFGSLGDLATTLKDFLRYCKINDIPDIQSDLFS